MNMVEEDPSIIAMRLVYHVVTKYLWMLVVGIGLFGNIMSIIVTLQKENRRISTCNYMAALALADSMVLIEVAWGMARLFWMSGQPSEFTMQ